MAFGGNNVEMIVDLTASAHGYLGILVFLLAYSLVPLENYFHLRKSKPVLLAAGLIWIFVALAYKGSALHAMGLRSGSCSSASPRLAFTVPMACLPYE